MAMFRRRMSAVATAQPENAAESTLIMIRDTHRRAISRFLLAALAVSSQLSNVDAAILFFIRAITRSNPRFRATPSCTLSTHP